MLDHVLRPVPVGRAGRAVPHRGAAGPRLPRAARADRRAASSPTPSARPATRMYRTGDLVRRRADGALEYLGRTDHQVKIRGQPHRAGRDRGRARRAARRGPGAVVVARRDLGPAPRLVAYVVPAAGSAPEAVDPDAAAGRARPTCRTPWSRRVRAARRRCRSRPAARSTAGPCPDPTAADGATGGGVRAATTGAAPSSVAADLAALFAEVLGRGRGRPRRRLLLAGRRQHHRRSPSRPGPAPGLRPRPARRVRAPDAGGAGRAGPRRGRARCERARCGRPGRDRAGRARWASCRRWRGGGRPAATRGRRRWCASCSLQLPVAADADLDVDAQLAAAVAAVVDLHHGLRQRVRDLGSDLWATEIGPPGSVHAGALVRRVDVRGLGDAAARARARGRGGGRGRSARPGGRRQPAGGLVRRRQQRRRRRRRRGDRRRRRWARAGRGRRRPGRPSPGRGRRGRPSRGRGPRRRRRRRALAPVPTSLRAWAARLADEARSADRLAELPHWLDVLAPGGRLLRSPGAVDRCGRRAGEGAPMVHAVELDAAATALVGARGRLGAGHGRGGRARRPPRRGRALRADSGDPEPRRALVVDVVSSGRPAAGALGRTVGRLEAARPVRLDPREATGLAALKRVKEQRRAAPGDGLGFGRAAAPARAAPPPGWRRATGPTCCVRHAEAPAERAVRRPRRQPVRRTSCDDPAGRRLRAVWSTPSGSGLDDAALAALARRAGGEALADPGRRGRRAPAPAGSPRRTWRPWRSTRPPSTRSRPPSPTPSRTSGRCRRCRRACSSTPRSTPPPSTSTRSPTTSTSAGRSTSIACARALRRPAAPQPHAARRLPRRRAAPPGAGHRRAERRRRPARRRRPGGRRRPPSSPLASTSCSPPSGPGASTCSRPPLLHVTVVRLGPDRCRIMVSRHLLLWDGWSGQLVFGELFRLYEAGGGRRRPRPARGAADRGSYRDYLAWLAEQDDAAARAAWRGALDGLDEPTLVAPVAGAAEPVLPDTSPAPSCPTSSATRVRGLARRRGPDAQHCAQRGVGHRAVGPRRPRRRRLRPDRLGPAGRGARRRAASSACSSTRCPPGSRVDPAEPVVDAAPPGPGRPHRRHAPRAPRPRR